MVLPRRLLDPVLTRPTVPSRHLRSLAKVLAGSDDQSDEGRGGGAQSRHPNPSGGGGLGEPPEGQGDQGETHRISAGLDRWKMGVREQVGPGTVFGVPGQRPILVTAESRAPSTGSRHSG